MQPFTEDRQKFKALVLYVIQRCASKHNFGVTTLNKILWYADNFAYGKLGKPITGAEYWKDRHGPVPKYAPEVRTQLQRENRLRVERLRTKRGRDFEKLTVLQPPDMSMFSTEELEVVNDVIKDHWKLSTRKAKKRSHDEAAWRAARRFETIPYAWIFIDDDQRITAAEIARYRALAQQHGWLSGRS